MCDSFTIGCNSGISICFALHRKVSQYFSCGWIVISKVLVTFRSLPFFSNVVFKYVGCRGHIQSPLLNLLLTVMLWLILYLIAGISCRQSYFLYFCNP